MKLQIWLAAAFILFFSSKGHAQQPFQLWGTYNIQARVSNKWGYAFDLNHRTRGVLPFTSSLTAARMGISYQLNASTRITAGYAWFGTHVSDRIQLWLHENRIYQQIQFSNIKHGLQFVHRIRLEQRLRQEFVEVSSDRTTVAFTFRARYLFQLQGPLKKKSGTEEMNLSWQATNEIFLHTGQNLRNSNFDQNRTLAGIVIAPNPKVSIAVLYQLILQRQPLLQTTQAIHSMRLTFFQNLDFRKQD